MSQQIENIGANGISIPVADAQARASITQLSNSLTQKTYSLTNPHARIYAYSIRRSGNVVEVNIELTEYNDNSQITVGVLPEEIRPTNRTNTISVVSNNTGTSILGHCNFVINTNGTITAQNFGTYVHTFCTLVITYVI